MAEIGGRIRTGGLGLTLQKKMVWSCTLRQSDCFCSDVRAVEEPRAGRAATLWALLLFFYSMVLGGNGTVNQEQNFGNFSSSYHFILLFTLISN